MNRALKRLWLLAVLATVLLSYASVRSVTMQAVMAAGHEMPGMRHAVAAPADPHLHHHMHGDAGSPHAGHMHGAAPAEPPPSSDSKAADPCAFCQAAAHAPLLALATPPRPPSAVAYLPPSLAETPGAPALWRERPRARGPPASA